MKYALAAFAALLLPVSAFAGFFDAGWNASVSIGWPSYGYGYGSYYPSTYTVPTYSQGYFGGYGSTYTVQTYTVPTHYAPTGTYVVSGLYGSYPDPYPGTGGYFQRSNYTAFPSGYSYYPYGNAYPSRSYF